jgi:hypothetical protein
MAQDITYVGISGLTYKSTDDGTLIVYGKATGPDLDMDKQICDAEWLKTAMPAWFQTGANVREQHSSIVAGIGLELEANGDDWMLKSEVIDPVTKIKVEKKALSGYSIGIKNARVVKDANAPGGRIIDGDIVEVSLVDRPANPTATVQIAKMAGGQIELSKSDVIAQDSTHVELPATDGTELYEGVKVCSACEGTGRAHADLPNDDTKCNRCGGSGKEPKGAAQDIQAYSPSNPDGGQPANDMVDDKATEPEIEKREFSEAEREAAAESGAAMAGGGFPIKSVKDLKNAIQAIGRAKDRAATIAHIKDRAKALGREDLIPDSFKAVEHDEATLNQVRAGIIALIKAELDEMLNGQEDEIGDVSELLCTLQYFLCWWEDEADEGETAAPFVMTEDETNELGDDMAYIGLGVSADIIKSAAAPEATDADKTALRDEIRKALGVEEEIATYKAAIAEQEEATKSLKAALDEIREMATPGGPVLRQTSVKANKALDVERLDAEAARLRKIAQEVQEPAMKAAYIQKAAQLAADARSIAKA